MEISHLITNCNRSLDIAVSQPLPLFYFVMIFRFQLLPRSVCWCHDEWQVDRKDGSSSSWSHHKLWAYIALCRTRNQSRSLLIIKIFICKNWYIFYNTTWCISYLKWKLSICCLLQILLVSCITLKKLLHKLHKGWYDACLSVFNI